MLPLLFFLFFFFFFFTFWPAVQHTWKQNTMENFYNWISRMTIIEKDPPCVNKCFQGCRGGFIFGFRSYLCACADFTVVEAWVFFNDLFTQLWQAFVSFRSHFFFLLTKETEQWAVPVADKVSFFFSRRLLLWRSKEAFIVLRGHHKKMKTERCLRAVPA